jgi:hypothetical protein
VGGAGSACSHDWPDPVDINCALEPLVGGAVGVIEWHIIHPV